MDYGEKILNRLINKYKEMSLEEYEEKYNEIDNDTDVKIITNLDDLKNI
ncbi:MAG: hypothetical protein WDK95_06720 [Syntrophorhabdaceae bacterium]|jgi:hypothetical protein